MPGCVQYLLQYLYRYYHLKQSDVKLIFGQFKKNMKIVV